MSDTKQMIVARVRDQRALIDLLTRRGKVLSELQAVSGINPANAISVVQDEIDQIETGIKELKPPPGSLPVNECG